VNGGDRAVTVTIPATDGVPLAGCEYRPGPDVRYDLLVLPGIGVPQRLFRHLGAWFAERQVRVVTVDYRGVGASRLAAALRTTARLSTWASRDAVGALRFVEETGNGAPVVLLGHSFGGQAIGFSAEFRRVAAAILVGAQFGQARHWDGLGRVKVAAYWNLILPAATALFEVVPSWTGLGTPLPRGAAEEWARWGRTRDWLLPHVPGAEALYAGFDRPLRAYATLDDPIAPPRAVAELLRYFRATSVERVDLAPSDLGLERLGHFGLFRPGVERLWHEFLEYGSRHAEGTPGRGSRGGTPAVPG